MVYKEMLFILYLKRAFCITYGRGLRYLKKESLHLNRGLEADQTEYWDINVRIEMLLTLTRFL